MNRNKILIPIVIFTTIIVVIIIIFNKSTRYDKISVDETRWNEILEKRSENKNLRLEDIEFNNYNLIIDESNDTLYYSLVNDSQNKYNPSIKYKAFQENIKIAVLEDKITDEKVKSGYEFYIMIYNEHEYHIYSLVCTNLPILNISYKEKKENKSNNIPIKVYLFNNLDNIPNRIMISDGKLKINEDNMIFSLNMITPGKNIRENKRAILNMKPNSEYILNSVNNAQNHGEDNHKIELFINNKYKGIFFIEQK